MADVHSKAQRSFNMSRIRGKDTKPEMILRKALHKAGFRYRLHVKDLPGTPDLVFTSRKKVIFVHGCYWHRHECRYGGVTPKTNADFWAAKIATNVLRDSKTIEALTARNWASLIVWECELRVPNEVLSRVSRFLS